ncbi:nicotinate-nucleotide--dimethylbenzimidazole phosphoribosyltransferase [Streptomyces sp. NPDC050658]|uniref:nicotinate-nucleotide--dimethylbenzimidazole phosphoribosyltransferase n=1 Tax=unclassified Streptomyces TaxID=2593676 RepID=UPI0034499254
MTDTGQVPAEGLPENAGLVEQPGVPAPGAYTYLDPSENPAETVASAEDDDLLLMPGAQGAWSEPQQGAPLGVAPQQGAQPVAAPAAAYVDQSAAGQYAGQPVAQPQVAQAQPQAVRAQAAHQPGPHETAGRDSGSVDLNGVQLPGTATPPPASHAGPARRPLHRGPSGPVVPDGTGSPVRSLADRGPAGAPQHVAPVRHAGPPTTGPEYLDVPREGEGMQPGPQLGEIPPQGATPWMPQPEPQVPAQAEHAVQGEQPAQPVPAEAPVQAPVQMAPVEQPAQPVAPAETVVPEATPVPQNAHATQGAQEPQGAQAAQETPVAEQAQAAQPAPVTELPEPVPAAAPAPEAVLAPPVAEQPVPVQGQQQFAVAAAQPWADAPAMGSGHLPHAGQGPHIPQDAQQAEPVVAHEPAPLGQFVPVEGSVPTTPHLAPTPPHPVVVAPEHFEAPQPEAAEPEPAAEAEPLAVAPQAEAPQTPEVLDTPAPVEAAEAAEVVEAPETAPAPETALARETEPIAEAAPVTDAPEVIETPEIPEITEAVEAVETVEAPEILEPAPQPAATVPAPRDGAEPAAEAPVPDAAATPVPEQPEEPVEAPEPVVAEAPVVVGPEAAAEPAEAAEPVQADGQAEPLETPAADVTESAAAPGYEDAEREAVLRVMRERRDIRNGFRSDPIPHEVLLRVLEAAHTAPSVGHSQPWDFVVIRSAETRRTMHELAMRQKDAYAKSLPKGRAKQFKELKIEAILDTPVNIVVTADPTRGGRHTLGRHTQPQMAPYSSALAVENLWLAARAEGLGVGWVSFFDEREMVRTLGLPEHLEVVAYLCVGYVDEFPEEPELMQAGWSKRRPLSWVVHEETYGRRALPGEDPHDLLAETVSNIRPLDAKALGEAWERQKRMTKPPGALGMLEIISAQLSGLSRQCPPPIPEPAAVAIFAGDHGVHAQGVTAWPQEVTAQMVANFLGGGAVCNAFANQVGAEVCVIDVGVASELPATPGLLPRKVRAGTADMTTGPALTREEVKAAIEVGIETARDLVAAGNKALLTGEMGIANTTASAALISVYTDTDAAEVTGRGTGINDEMHTRKVEVVRRALELHNPDPADPVGVLAAIGGLEHAAMVGLLLGGASLRTPVILDGVSAGAAALVARAIAPEVLAACIAGHRSAEPGHVAALNKLGLRPLVDLDLRLGEGTGALLALPVVQSAARAMHEVATFDSAGVTEK